MNDSYDPDRGGRSGVEANGADIPSAGAMLRSARESAGLHIAALAVALKVPVKKLEALEQDRIDLLPDAVFARALAAGVCRNLKVDPAPILERLPQNSARLLGSRDAGNQTPFRSSSGRISKRRLSNVSKPAWIAGASLSFAAIALLFLPQIQNAVRSIGKEHLLASGNSALGVSTGKLSGVLASPVIPIPAEMTELVSTPSLSLPTLVPSESKSTKLADVVENTASAVPSLGASGILTLSAKNESWVKVTDAKGVVLIRRLLLPGESVAASGALPLEAVIGRADTTRVEVRGRLLDLTPLTRDNVARFEVK